MHFLMRIIGIFISCFLFTSSGGQNLVPNPSFENYSSCPTGGGDVAALVSWTNPTSSTPDYFNECATSIPSGCSVPVNFVGYQWPRTGKGYAGLVTYVQVFPNARDYVSIELSDTLTPGQLYCVGYYVSLSNISQYASNAFSAYFSSTPVLSASGSVLPFIPQFNYRGGVVTDTLNWVLVDGQFVASGGEKYMTIGNFNTDANTATILINPSGAGGAESYYYIDDVYVGTCDTIKPASSLQIPNVFTPNNDQVNDVFRITTTNIQTLNCQIYDRWGIKVWELTTPFESWDGHNKTGVVCSDGVYYYVLWATGVDGKKYDKTGFVQLIR
jgi:gliding motility-associated-like protein